MRAMDRLKTERLTQCGNPPPFSWVCLLASVAVTNQENKL
jgi:hypothetical protein